MAFLRFMKLPTNNRYEYKPRYYDEKKEDLKNRLKRYSEKEEANSDVAKERISQGFRRRFEASDGARSFQRSQSRKSNIRLFAITLVLLLLCYLVLSEYLPRLIAFIEGGVQ